MTRHRRRVAVLLVALVLLTVGGLAVGPARNWWGHRAPYQPAAIAAHVQLWAVAPAEAQQFVDRLTGPARLSVGLPTIEPGLPAQNVIAGQLSFRIPHNASASGNYALFLLDATGKPLPAIWGSAPGDAGVSSGWDGRYEKIAAKYPWLQGLAAIQTGAGYTDPGMALSFAATTRSPVTFEANVRPDSLSITAPAQQLTVALVLLDNNMHAYWATKVVA